MNSYHWLMPPWLLDLFYLPALIAFVPILLYQRIILRKKRGGWAQRFGFIPQRRQSRPVIWVHAVSLGEVNATRTLIAEIRSRLPDHDLLISATTDTGYAAACQAYGAEVVFRYPLDFSFVVGRVLNRLQPAAIVLMELEVWPNLITLAGRRGIPIGIANGRVTVEKSMRRFRMPVIRGMARSMFQRMAWIGAQNEAYARLFEELGTPRERISITGSLKFDTAAIADSVPGDEALAAAMGIDRARPLLVAGSTGPGEEEMLLTAYGRLLARVPESQLALIPRKPERFDEVARLIESRGRSCVRRSARVDGASQAVPTGAVFLGDTMGELRKFYSLATVVFVGRTFVPMGGSDLMEVAGLGKAMCHGPFVENFADAAEKLAAARGAVAVRNADEMEKTLERLLADANERNEMGERARQVVRENAGATGRTVELLICALRGVI